MPSGLIFLRPCQNRFISWPLKTPFFISYYIFLYVHQFLLVLTVFLVSKLELKQSEFVFFFLDKLAVKPVLEADASKIWEAICVFNDLDRNWWCMRLFSSTTIVERLDQIVKGVLGVESSSCIGGAQMRFFLRMLHGLLEYCSIRLQSFQ